MRPTVAGRARRALWLERSSAAISWTRCWRRWRRMSGHRRPCAMPSGPWTCISPTRWWRSRWSAVRSAGHDRRHRCGAGFPGLALAVALPASEVRLVESQATQVRVSASGAARGEDRERPRRLCAGGGVVRGAGRTRRGAGARAGCAAGGAGVCGAAARAWEACSWTGAVAAIGSGGGGGLRGRAARHAPARDTPQSSHTRARATTICTSTKRSPRPRRAFPAGRAIGPQAPASGG